jgi:glycerol-3-phosphate dehydrogenase (NAD(P)+)
MTTTFSILGSGGWGTAIALLLTQNPNHRVRLWSAHANSARAIRHSRENVRLLPGVTIPESIAVTDDPAEAIDGADCWCAAIPTAYLRETLARFVPLRTLDVPVISLTKGLEIGTFQRPTEIIGEMLCTERLAVLSGPSHAEEVARGLPTSVVVAANDPTLAAPSVSGSTPTRICSESNLREL